MNRRAWWIAAAFLVAAGAGVAARLFIWPAQQTAEPDAPASETPTAVALTEELVLQPANLYFPSLQGGLRVHQQALPEGEPVNRIRTLVEALIDGPGGVVDGDLYSPVPESTTLGSVYFLRSGAVALDLRSKPMESAIPSVDDPEAEEREPEQDVPPPASEPSRPALGTEDELLAVYSLVNTVTLNEIDGVSHVVLLWDGRQPETFAGHIDVSRPLAPDTSWVITP